MYRRRLRYPRRRTQRGVRRLVRRRARPIARGFRRRVRRVMAPILPNRKHVSPASIGSHDGFVAVAWDNPYIDNITTLLGTPGSVGLNIAKGLKCRPYLFTDKQTFLNTSADTTMYVRITMFWWNPAVHGPPTWQDIFNTGINDAMLPFARFRPKRLQDIGVTTGVSYTPDYQIVYDRVYKLGDSQASDGRNAAYKSVSVPLRKTLNRSIPDAQWDRNLYLMVVTGSAGGRTNVGAALPSGTAVGFSYKQQLWWYGEQEEN